MLCGVVVNAVPSKSYIYRGLIELSYDNNEDDGINDIAFAVFIIVYAIVLLCTAPLRYMWCKFKGEDTR